MFDTSIEYCSIIMRCDHIYHKAYRNVPEHVTIEYYKDDMEEIWKDIQKEAGEFSTKTDQETLQYFSTRFGHQKDLLRKRCLFLKDKKTDQYIGTCMAWQAYQASSLIPILHWLAVSDRFAGQGYARILISQILQIFEKETPHKSIYLHTQPSSYQAIKLYHDFGFCLCRTDTYGNAINEYTKATSILKSVMTKESYTALIKDSIE